MDLSLDLLKLILPELLVSHFELTNHQTQQGSLHLYFEEKKDSPKEEFSRALIAHGCHKEISI